MMLNNMNRRALLKCMGLGPFLAKSSRFLQGDTAASSPLEHVMALTRTLNTITVVMVSESGSYPERSALLDRLRELQTQSKPGTGKYEWTSRLSFASDEILPGWFLDHHVKPGNTGYILLLIGSKGNRKSVVDH